MIAAIVTGRDITPEYTGTNARRGVIYAGGRGFKEAGNAIYLRRVKVKTVSVLLFVFTGVFFAGCASSPVINNFMNPGLPAEEHSVLSVHDNVMINNVDGDYTIRSIGGTGGSAFKRYPSILLIPGRHTLEVWYRDTTLGFERTETTSNTVSLTYTFLTGHFYRLYPEKDGGIVSFLIVDETDPAVWKDDTERISAAERIASQKDELSSVKPPKKAATEVLLRVAQAQEPTPFEGTWVLESPDMTITYIFEGKLYEFHNVMKRGEVGTRGMFEYTDNVLSLTPLEMYNPFDESWFKYDLLGLRSTAKVEYSFTDEGIALINKGETTGVLVKQR